LHRKGINGAAIDLDQFAVERLAIPPQVPNSPVEQEQLISRSNVWKFKIAVRSFAIQISEKLLYHHRNIEIDVFDLHESAKRR